MSIKGRAEMYVVPLGVGEWVSQLRHSGISGTEQHQMPDAVLDPGHVTVNLHATLTEKQTNKKRLKDPGASIIMQTELK